MHEEQARWVRWIYDQLEQHGTSHVMWALEERGVTSPTGQPRWSKSTLLKLISNPLYKGVYEYGRQGERLTLPVQALVTQEQWERTLAAMKRRSRDQRRAGTLSHIYELQGLARCGQCGSTISAHTPRARTPEATRHRYYHCRGTLKIMGARCNHRTYYRIEDLHQVVQAGLRSLVTDDQGAEAGHEGAAPGDPHAQR